MLNYLRRTRCTLAGLGLFVFNSQSVYAEDLLDLSLHQLMELKVSVASLDEEPAYIAPSSVTVFSKQQIRQMGVKDLESLLRYVPGFHIGRAVELGQGYALSSRGRTTSQSSPDVLILLNGQRLNTEWSGGALFYNRFISLSNIKQVEIIRGPGSAIYGSNAFSGVVNLITEKDGNYVGVKGGSQAYKQAVVKTSGEHETLAWSLFAEASDTDGEVYTMEQGFPVETHDPYSTFDFEGYLGISRFDAHVHHSRRTLEDFYQFGRFVNDEINEYESEQTLFNALYQYDQSEKISHTFRFEYGYSKRDGLIEAIPQAAIQNLPPSLVTTGAESFIGGPRAEEESYRYSYQGKIRINAAHTLNVGADYRNIDLKKLRNYSNYDFADFVDAFVLNAPPPTGNLTYYGELQENATFGKEGQREITSLFIQDKWTISNTLFATLGLRSDDYSDFGSATTPRLSIVHSWDQKNTLKYMYGEAFRAPSRREQTAINTPAIVGNDDIKPEEISTFEIAWLHRRDRLDTSLTAYHSEIDNVIEEVAIGGNDPRNTYQNSKALTVSGIEAEAFWTLTSGLTLGANLTHLISDQDAPQQYPDNTASVITNFQYQSLNLNLNGIYVSKTESKVDDGSGGLVVNEHGAYVVWNSALSYRHSKSFSGQMVIENLLDKEYRTSTSTTELTQGVLNKGRSIIAGLTYRF